MKTKTIFLLLALTLTSCINNNTNKNYNVADGTLIWDKDTLLTFNNILDNVTYQTNDYHDGIIISITTRTLNDTVINISPLVGDSLYLPIGEGKYFSFTDKLWIEHLAEKEYSAISNLSMPFISIVKNNSAYTFVFDNPCRTQLYFKGDSILNLSIENEFISLDSIRTSNIIMNSFKLL